MPSDRSEWGTEPRTPQSLSDWVSIGLFGMPSVLLGVTKLWFLKSPSGGHKKKKKRNKGFVCPLGTGIVGSTGLGKYTNFSSPPGFDLGSLLQLSDVNQVTDFPDTLPRIVDRFS